MRDSLPQLPDRNVQFDTQTLRSHTSAAHRSVEQSLKLPECILNFEDYRSWLVRFFGIYFPIEARLGRFRGWEQWAIPIDQLGHTANLSKDLAAMGVPIEQVALASEEDMPLLSNFAEALGTLYVIEGSKLGGRFILDDLLSRLRPRIDGATSFFAGHGAQMGERWNAFKSSVDRFLSENPAEFPDVSAGAIATFASIQSWMFPLTERSKP